jgi:octaprenyl-diphosphate synthase
MSEGELLQIEKSRSLDITEEVYFEIIRQKTATLIAACCGVGAASVNDSKEMVELMSRFGEKIGLAFQMKDDLFDYGNDDIGKPLGIDIKEKKLTLPLIHTLSHLPQGDRSSLKRKIKNHKGKSNKINEIISIVKENKGLDYTTQKMHDLKNEALQMLDELPNSNCRRSLKDLSNFIIERKK